jgi:hypothetical protein
MTGRCTAPGRSGRSARGSRPAHLMGQKLGSRPARSSCRSLRVNCPPGPTFCRAISGHRPHRSMLIRRYSTAPKSAAPALFQPTESPIPASPRPRPLCFRSRLRHRRCPAGRAASMGCRRACQCRRPIYGVTSCAWDTPWKPSAHRHSCKRRYSFGC